ncbi:ROK family protein [Arthrobacter sp. 18067]|uniref:ROK family protein n=1 Tax=Arthrobacter sp. 18067 TaxID=2681413 RepID=UPI0013584E66|nr:ROK family protein [Arthrobacter sp. 18067]
MIGSRLFGRSSNAPVGLAIEIGEAAIRGAVFGMDGVARFRRSSPTGPPGDGVVHRTKAILRALATDARANGLVPVGIGIAGPGTIGAAPRGAWTHTPLPWSRLWLADAFREDLGLPVAINTTVAAIGLAESFAAVPGEPGITAFVELGPGVRAAIFSGGHLVRGSTDGAGELGHLPVMPDGEWCRCGQRGCLEVYFSSRGLVRRYRARGGGSTFAPADIARRWDDDPVCGLVWNEGLRAFALGLAALTLLVDPAAIILGGGLSRSALRLSDSLEPLLAELLAWRGVPAIRPSQLGPGAAQLGAAILAFQAAGSPSIGTAWDLHSTSRDAASNHKDSGWGGDQ